MGFWDLFGVSNKNSGVVLDIGTEFVKALIFKVEDKTARIIGCGRAREKLTDIQGGVVTDIEGVVENCRKALVKAEKMAKIAPTRVVMGIAGELVKGMTTTVHYDRAHPRKKIEFSELKTIVEKVQGRAYAKAREILSTETGHKEIDIKLVNAAIVDVQIDGYRVVNPIGFQGKDVCVSVFNAFAPIVHLGALQTVADELGLELAAITPEPYAVAKAVGLEESSDFSAIFMDVGGGTTDIAVVCNGSLEGTKMFAIGGRTFTKRLADTMSISFKTAEEMKISYAKGLLDEKTTKMVRDALNNDCQVWLSGVQLTLEEFEKVDFLPSRILLCGGASQLPDLKKILDEDDWQVGLPFTKKPKIEFIQLDQISNVEDVTGVLENPIDITPMALANVALDYSGKVTIMDNILNKMTISLRS